MRFPILCLLLLSALGIEAQEAIAITLTNPSFEDMPRVGAAPVGWDNCGFIGESPVDIQPDPQKEFKVEKPAYHGKTYLGMVTRDNETYERVGQFMSSPMIPGQCYELDIFLARSDTYLSKSRRTDNDANYVTPIRLRVWGGYGRCDPRQLLGESPLITNWHWQDFRIKLEPDQDYTYIVLEAYYKQPILLPYNGNILLDNVRPLRPVACDEDLDALPPPAESTEPVVTQRETPATPTPAGPTPRPRTRPSQEPSSRQHTNTPAAPVVELGKTRGELRIGQVFEMEEISFQANSAVLEAESEAALAEIANFLRANGDVVVEIGGHASYQAGPVYANRISEQRAVAVIDYLEELNIGRGQLLARGYGRSRPLCTEDTDSCNERNQRVEVKILKIRPSR
jgi:outer membrane protein OmpA-like peptidoglycan-associated protein